MEADDMRSMAEQDTANAATSASAGVPEIHEHEAHRRYKLIGKDNTEIEHTAAEILEGSKLLSNRNLWFSNFSATIHRVQAWCDEHSGHIRMALVDIRSNKVLFYFVPQSGRYDLELGDEMTALEVQLGGSAGIGYVETLQVPERSLDSFVGKRSLLLWRRDATA
jgi:hypothetical protein